MAHTERESDGGGGEREGEGKVGVGARGSVAERKTAKEKEGGKNKDRRGARRTEESRVTNVIDDFHEDQMRVMCVVRGCRSVRGILLLPPLPPPSPPPALPPSTFTPPPSQWLALRCKIVLVFVHRNAFVSVGVDRVVAVDLHCGQIQGFFGPRVPVDNLDGGVIGVGYFGDTDLHNPGTHSDMPETCCKVLPNGFLAHAKEEVWHFLPQLHSAKNCGTFTNF